ncbi:MAG: 2-oxo-4-hydroxy-4-carboxy-5-ureidoimidazoline decarboxylase [Jatrophihabitans sp.]
MPAAASRIGLDEFGRLAEPVATALLADCCSSQEWSARLLAGRPYRWLEELLAGSDAAIGALDQRALLEVVQSHPRLGERPAGDTVAAAWSRAEQAGALGSARTVEAALRQANLDYEQRFDHVFLSCATGKGAAELVAEIGSRIANEPDAELEVARTELRKIVRTRLERVFQ